VSSASRDSAGVELTGEAATIEPELEAALPELEPAPPEPKSGRSFAVRSTGAPELLVSAGAAGAEPPADEQLATITLEAMAKILRQDRTALLCVPNILSSPLGLPRIADAGLRRSTPCRAHGTQYPLEEKAGTLTEDLLPLPQQAICE
jgi:hypothetical protein